MGFRIFPRFSGTLWFIGSSERVFGGVVTRHSMLRRWVVNHNKLELFTTLGGFVFEKADRYHLL
jgi:hypothetical protein